MCISMCLVMKLLIHNNTIQVLNHLGISPSFMTLDISASNLYFPIHSGKGKSFYTPK